MSDRSPNYDVERKRLEVKIFEHESTIERGKARLAEIERQKKMNVATAEISNMDLDSEAARIKDNEAALVANVAEIQANLAAMVKGDAPAT
jgi:predicted  nucleic acid-binding Zn-ribbon protein